MGSRLKGKKARKSGKLEDWRVGKLIVYAVLAIVLTVLLVIAYYQYGTTDTQTNKKPDTGQAGESSS